MPGGSRENSQPPLLTLTSVRSAGTKWYFTLSWHHCHPCNWKWHHFITRCSSVHLKLYGFTIEFQVNIRTSNIAVSLPVIRPEIMSWFCRTLIYEICAIKLSLGLPVKCWWAFYTDFITQIASNNSVIFKTVTWDRPLLFSYCDWGGWKLWAYLKTLKEFKPEMRFIF